MAGILKIRDENGNFVDVLALVGIPGEDGIDGIDGISPTVAISDIDGGHHVAVTDKDGTKSFDVMNGKDGNVSCKSIATEVCGSYIVLASPNGSTFKLTVSDDGVLSAVKA